MRKLILGLTAVLLIIALGACSGAARLSEEEAAEVVEVLSSIAADAFNGEASRAATATFTHTSSEGGAVEMVYSATAVEGVDGVEGAVGGFNASFTDFIFTHVDEDGTETEYTLNGTVYMEYSIGPASTDTGYSSAFSYEFLMYTDADDTLSIDGGTIDTALNINVQNTVKHQIGTEVGVGFKYRIDYSCTGEVNGRNFNDETGSMEYTYAL